MKQRRDPTRRVGHAEVLCVSAWRELFPQPLPDRQHPERAQPDVSLYGSTGPTLCAYLPRAVIISSIRPRSS